MENFQGIIPEKGFLRDYVDYASPLTDAPVEFHFFTGLAILSSIIGRRVKLGYGKGLYPNLYVLLCARSSKYRKSTALGFGEEIVRAVNRKYVLPQEFTQEALWANLESQPHGLFTFSEFGTLLSSAHKKYMSGILEFLTDLYDCPPERSRILKSGEYTICNPFINILAASTIEWVTKNIDEADMYGGFFARFVFVFPTGNVGFTPMCNLPKPDEKKKAELVNHLEKLGGKYESGELSIDDSARSLAIDWSTVNNRNIDLMDVPGNLGGFITRLEANMYKFAMLYQLAEPEPSLAISEDNILRAITLAEWSKDSLFKLSKKLVFTQGMKEQQKVLEIIEKKPGLTRRDLQQRAHLDANIFGKLMGSIQKEQLVYTNAGCIYIVSKS